MAEQSSSWTVSLRPTKLKDVYGLDTIKKYIYKKSKDGEWPNILYLQGNTGSGKTTIAKIAAQMMVCQHPDADGEPCCECASCKAIIDEKWNRDVVRKNCRELGGVEGLRDFMRNFTAGAPFNDKRKVLILDELQELADSGKAAVDSLLTYAEATRPNIRCIFTSMLDPAKESNSNGVKTAFKALTDRATTFKMPYARYEDCMKYMMDVLQTSGKWDEAKMNNEEFFGVLSLIAQAAAGSYRNCLSNLQTVLDCECYSTKEAKDLLHIEDEATELEMLLDIMDGKATPTMFETILNTKDYGMQFGYMLKGIADAESMRMFGQLPGQEWDFLKKQAAKVCSHKNFPLVRDELLKMQNESNGFIKKSQYLLMICALIEKCKKANTTPGITPAAAPTGRRIIG